MRQLPFLALLVVLAGCDFIGGADTLVRGSHNFIAKDDAAELVARDLAALEAVPAVTDEELLAIYDTIRSRAMAGELDAVRVLARLAALQRTDEEEAADSNE
ncbi:MAG: hypothetical protein AB7I04_21730 [Pseudomonadales bacterium]